MFYRRLIFLSLIVTTLWSCGKPEIKPNFTEDVVVESDSILFGIIGDYGESGDPENDVSELVKSWSPDFIITLGDNNYPNGELLTIKENISQYYDEFIFNPDAPQGLRCKGFADEGQQNRFFPALGNHDFNNNDFNIPYLNFFDLPGKEVYYEFKWGSVHFFALNSGPSGNSSCCNSEQSAWLKEKLQSSTSAFKIVYFHHSPYTSAKHGNSEDMQWPFKEWGADAVLSGHNHVYERISKLNEPDLIYLVNGVGGRKSFHDCEINPLPSDLFENLCITGKYGAIKCTASSEALTFQFFSIEDWDNPLDEIRIIK